jgi:hypothetical protein
VTLRDFVQNKEKPFLAVQKPWSVRLIRKISPYIVGIKNGNKNRE